ncbi:MAG TPA: hypothetical protein VHN78_11050, partial [Chloroflexota bacterium]|nr:hypothetical protein [Chloroflexota bacterium]
MARALATLVAFYSDQETAPQAMRELRRGGFRRVATIRHAEPGRLMVTDNDVSPGVGALIGALLALGVLVTSFSRFFPSYAPPPTVPWLAVAGAVVLIGAGVGWLCARWLDFGVDEATLTRFRRWVLPGETLLILQAPPSRGPEVLAQLRQVQGATPTTFVLRPSHELGWSGGMSGERPPLERFTTERLKSHAAALAAAHEIEPRRRRWGRGRPLWGRLRGSERTIESVVVGLTEAVHLEQSISLAAEWLLDNGYIMRRHIGDVRRNLSRSLYDVLPLLRGQVLSGPGGLLGSMGSAGTAGPSRPHDQPRVYALALEFVSHTDGEVHVADVVEFLRAYQETAPLTSGELWAMPLMLRLALIENLGRLAVAIDRRQYEHERADLWANRLLSAARRDPDQLLFILAELAREHPQPPPYFALRLVSQLQGEATALDPIRGWLERKLSTPLPDVIQHEQLRQAADQVTVANAIGSLRRLSSVDWRDVFEEISLVHQVLGEDPAGIYARMDFGSRDRYRHAVEEIAKPARLSEVEVARLAVEVSNASGVPRPESRVDRSPGTRDEGLATHVGYHLVDDGRLAFERRAGSRPRPARRFRRWVLAHPALIYLGGIALLTAALLAETLVVAHRLDIAGPLLVAMGLLALLPVSELAVQFVNNLSTELLKPRVLPKLNFEDGIPEEWRTLVVVPVLF